MLSIDEVITALEQGPRSNIRDDAVTYLTEYKGLSKMWNDKLDKEQENPPLDWETLKQMTGKPVWVEYNLHISDRDARSRMWIIVQKIMPWRQDDELIYYSGFVFGKKEIGKTWQAYLKGKK